MTDYPELGSLGAVAKDLRRLRTKQADAEPERVKQSYEDHWGTSEQAIADKVQAGEDIAHIILALRGRAHLVKQTGERGEIAAALRDEAGLPPAADSLVRATVAGGFNLAINFDPMMLLASRAASARNAVELGSGPGWNLFEIALLLGRAAEKVRFFALEYTEAGLGATRRLAALDRAPPVSAVDHRVDQLGIGGRGKVLQPLRRDEWGHGFLGA